MNRQEVMEKLAPLTTTTVRNFEQTTHGKVGVGEIFTLRPGSGKTYEVDERAVPNLFAFAGVPMALQKKVSDSTIGQVLTECMRHKGQYGLLFQDGKIGDFLPYGERQQIPAERALATVESVVPDADYTRALLLPNRSASIEVMGGEAIAVRQGDLVRAGTRIMFSPIGTIKPCVQSYAVRLTCTNGATTHDVFREWGPGEGDNVWQWFRQSIQQSVRAVQRIVTRWQNMLQEQIAPEDRAMVIERFIKEAHMPVEVAKAFRSQAIQNPPDNSYDALQLLTYVTTHMLTEPQTVVRAQLVAAQYGSTTAHKRICPTCNRER